MLEDIKIGTTFGRYKLLSEIGRGGMAVVYKALDTVLGREIAIKILHPDKNSNSEIDRLVLQEAITASGLNHPNIITIYDVGQQENYYFIAMELINGYSLRDKLSKGHLAPSEAIELAIQIAEGLGAAHSLGIIHRDVKPENIIIRNDGYVKLLDFGLAKICPGSVLDEAKSKSTLGRVGQLNTQRIMQGTVGYMSPEQVRGEDVDLRSDLFSLGIVIYEMLTGQVPFTAKTLADKMLAILRLEVTPPSQIINNLTSEFDLFMTKALAKRKEDRFQNSLAMIRALKLIELGKNASATTTWSLPKQAGQSAQTIAEAVENLEEEVTTKQGFIGRSKELESLESTFEQVLKDKSQVTIVIGEAGQGKSALINQFRERNKDKAKFLSGRFFENICGLPFITFLEALSEYWNDDSLDPNQNLLGELFEDRTREIEEALKKKDTVRASRVLLQLQGGTEQAIRSFEAIRRCLKELSRHKPIVFIIDNLQWADDASLLAFVYLVRTLSNVPILLMTTLRSEHLTQGSTLKNWVEKMSHRANVSICNLAPFTIIETSQLLNLMCPGIGENDFLLNTLYRETNGNPYFIKEMLMLWLEDGTIRKQQGKWVVSNIENIDLPKSITGLIEMRLNNLDKPIADVLTQAAVIGDEFSFNFLQIVTQLDEEELIYILETAIKRNLINEVGSGQPGDDTYIFHHSFIQQALYQSLSSRRKRQLHEKVADALQKCFATMIEKVTPQIAYHYYHASMPEKAFEFAVRAAEQERRAGSASEQSRYLEWAKNALSEMATDLHDKKSLRLMATYRLGLGSIASLKGKSDVALSHLEEALIISSKAADDQLHGAILNATGMLHLLLTDYQSAQKHFAEAISLFERVGDSAQRLEALSGFALSKSFEVKELERAARWLLAVAGKSSQAKGFAYTALALSDVQVGLLGQAVKHYNKSLENLEAAGETSQHTRTLCLLGTAYTARRQFDLAEDCCRRGLEQAASINVFAELIAHTTMVPVLLHRGQIDKAEETIQHVLHLSQKSSNRLHISRAYAELAEVNYQSNKLGEAINNYKQAIELFTLLKYPYRLAESLAKLSLCYLKDKQIDKALETCRQARALSRENQFRYSLMISSEVMARCLVNQNRLSEAKTYVREANHALEEMKANLPEDAVSDFLSDKTDLLNLYQKHVGN
jgi:serine/threonine protein kinase/tetratricopeptide (TPR) repeat protein